MVDGEPLAEYLKDALHLYTHGEPIDSLIQYVGLTGLQYAGVCHLDLSTVTETDKNNFSVLV